MPYTAIVVVTNQGNVLLGCGGTYMMDRYNRAGRALTAAERATSAALANDQRFPGPNDDATEHQATAAFAARRPGVNFTPPEWKSDAQGGRWTTRYLEAACDERRRGFIKGGDKPEDHGVPTATAVREMFEETGFTIPAARLAELGIGNRMFLFEATDAEAASIVSSWRGLAAKELVDLAWRPIARLSNNAINGESQPALAALRAHLAPPVPPAGPAGPARYVPPHKRQNAGKTRRVGKKRKARKTRHTRR